MPRNPVSYEIIRPSETQFLIKIIRYPPDYYNGLVAIAQFGELSRNWPSSHNNQTLN
ncbi:MAG: hypothetical protein F6K35_08760 [Okeania sp. SIO2H7]|nr:hypothetical protein [Okeania sp. SIO2H7]